MNASHLIQIFQLFKKEAIVMKPLRFWAIYAAVSGSSIMYLLPRFLEALK